MRVILAIGAVLTLSACADRLYYPNGKLAAVLMSDRTNETFTGPGITYHVDTALHSPVARTHWHGVISLGGEAAGAFIGAQGGTQALGGAVSIVTSVVNRPTNRATPTPVPAVLQNKH